MGSGGDLGGLPSESGSNAFCGESNYVTISFEECIRQFQLFEPLIISHVSFFVESVSFFP